MFRLDSDFSVKYILTNDYFETVGIAMVRRADTNLLIRFEYSWDIFANNSQILAMGLLEWQLKSR